MRGCGEDVAPVLECEFGRDCATLSEAEPVDTCEGPTAIGGEMGKNAREEIDGWSGVGPLEQFAEGIEGCVPLVGFFV